MAAADTPTKEVHKKTEGVENGISRSKADDPSPFLKELGSITGPNAAKTSMDKLDKDGYTGRAEALEARNILQEVKGGAFYRHLPGTSNELTKKDVEDYAKRPNLSDGERAVAQRLAKDFDKIPHTGESLKPSDIESHYQKETDRGNLRNLYSKRPDGGSLYNDVKSPTGGISGDKLDKALANPNISDQDKASLQALQDQRELAGVYGFRKPTGDLSVGTLNDMGDKAGLSAAEKNGLKKQGPTESNADQDAKKTAADAIKDLTAKPRGGGESLLDKIGDGQGGVDQQKVTDFLNNKDKHNLTPENEKTLKYLDSQIQKKQDDSYIPNGSPDAPSPYPSRENLSKQDLQKAGADAGVDFDKALKNPARAAESGDQKQNDANMSHLFDAKKGEKSLYEQVKNEEGGISASKVEEALKTHHKPEDVASLNYLKNLADNKYMGLGPKADISKDDFTQAAKEHNVKGDKLHAAGLDIPIPTPRPEVQGPPAPPELKPEVKAALTVPSHGGYFHVAEQMLSAAHKDQKNYEPSQKELKELVKQLQHANHNKKSLSHKEPLVIDDEIRKNPAVAKLFA